MKINTVILLVLSTLLPFSCQISGTEECPETTTIPLSQADINQYYTRKKMNLVFQSDTLFDTLFIQDSYEVATIPSANNDCVLKEKNVIVYKSNNVLSQKFQVLVLQATIKPINSAVMYACSSEACPEYRIGGGEYSIPETELYEITRQEIKDTIYENVVRVSYSLKNHPYQLFFSEEGKLIRIGEPERTWDYVEW